MSLCSGEGCWGFWALDAHLELILVNLDDPQGSKKLCQVGSLIAVKESFLTLRQIWKIGGIYHQLVQFALLLEGIVLPEAPKVCAFQTRHSCLRHLIQIIWQSAILRNCPCSWGAFLVLDLLYTLNKAQPWTFFSEFTHTSCWHLYVPSKEHTSIHDASTKRCYWGIRYLWFHFIPARQAQGVILSLKGYCRGAREQGCEQSRAFRRNRKGLQHYTGSLGPHLSPGDGWRVQRRSDTWCSSWW